MSVETSIRSDVTPLIGFPPVGSSSFRGCPAKPRKTTVRTLGRGGAPGRGIVASCMLIESLFPSFMFVASAFSTSSFHGYLISLRLYLVILLESCYVIGLMLFDRVFLAFDEFRGCPFHDDIKCYPMIIRIFCSRLLIQLLQQQQAQWHLAQAFVQRVTRTVHRFVQRAMNPSASAP